MPKFIRIVCGMVIAGAMMLPDGRAHAFEPQKGLIVLCYHDVPEKVALDDYGVDQRTFVQTIEYFRAHEYTFISLEDLVAAHRSGESLPEKSVMLTFDDGYQTFYDFVYPILHEYKIPSVLAIVTSWINGPPPEYVKQPLMTWDQIKDVSQSPYVEVIAHSHDLHKAVPYNPQGNVAAAATSRVYDAASKAYEDEQTYRQRIQDDLKESKRILEEKIQTGVRAIAWPFGKYSALTLEESKALGFEISFALNDKRAAIGALDCVERYVISKNPELPGLLRNLRLLPLQPAQARIMQADLDLIYDADPAVTERNLSLFLDRVKAMGVTAVYLQAFSDPDGDGNVSEVYFPNRVLPLRADLFNRVAHQLRTRSLVEVYAWMPMLSLSLPDQAERERLRVRENKGRTTQLSTSWYERLSPFSDDTWALLKQLYEDMIVHSFIDGVVFQDDGYLNDFEDYHPDALAFYEKATGSALPDSEQLTSTQRQEWTRMKTARLNDLSRALMATVRTYWPEAKFARTFYAPVLTDPASEEWLAQNYGQALELYDYVVIMAYSKLEKVKRSSQWLKALVREAARHEQGLKKTVFKVQAYDWKEGRQIETDTMDRWLRTLVAEGALNLAYYLDNVFQDHPKAKIIRRMMSREDFPFPREWK